MAEKYIKLQESEKEKLVEAMRSEFASESRVATGAFVGMLAQEKLESEND